MTKAFPVGVAWLLAAQSACGSSTCDLSGDLRKVAGNGAKDCGHVTVGSNTAKVDACVVDAFGKHAAFFAQYDRHGTDSQITSGLAGTTSGNVALLMLDSDPSGGSGAHPVITADSCKNPSVDTSTGRDTATTLPITCASTASLGNTCE
jgi:hypothetical protein